MTHETNGTPRLPPERAASDFAQLLSRLFDLMELQIKLLGVDAKKSGKTILLAGTSFALALGLAIATTIVLLLTLGAIIAESTQLSVGTSLLTLLKEYARERPEVLAYWTFGIGFVLGWKLKLW
jgi:hypothetical protein